MENEPPHTDVQKQSDGGQHDHDGRPPIAHEGERNADDGENTQNHSGIDKNTPEYERRDPQGNEASQIITGVESDFQTPHDQGQKQRKQYQGPNKSPLLSKDGKNKIRLLLRQKLQMSLRSF